MWTPINSCHCCSTVLVGTESMFLTVYLNQKGRRRKWRPVSLSISTAEISSFFDERPSIRPRRDNLRLLLTVLAVYDAWRLTEILEMLKVHFFGIFSSSGWHSKVLWQELKQSNPLWTPYNRVIADHIRRPTPAPTETMPQDHKTTQQNR